MPVAASSASCSGIDTKAARRTSIELALVVIVFLHVSSTSIGLHLLRFIVNVGISAEIVASVRSSVGALDLCSTATSPGLHARPHLGRRRARQVECFPAFVAALAFGGWVLFGFDACGAIAEETQNASRQVPRAILNVARHGRRHRRDRHSPALCSRSPSIASVSAAARRPDPVSAPVHGRRSAAGFHEAVPRDRRSLGFVSWAVAVQAATVRVISRSPATSMLPAVEGVAPRLAVELLETPIGSAAPDGNARGADLPLREGPERARRVRDRWRSTLISVPRGRRRDGVPPAADGGRWTPGYHLALHPPRQRRHDRERRRSRPGSACSSSSTSRGREATARCPGTRTGRCSLGSVALGAHRRRLPRPHPTRPEVHARPRPSVRGRGRRLANRVSRRLRPRRGGSPFPSQSSEYA